MTIELLNKYKIDYKDRNAVCRSMKIVSRNAISALVLFMRLVDNGDTITYLEIKEIE